MPDPQILRTFPMGPATRADPPIPVLAGLRWQERDHSWGPTQDVDALALAWTYNPNCVLIRWTHDGREREDWIGADYVGRLDR